MAETKTLFHVHAPLPSGYDRYKYEDLQRYAKDVMDLLKRYFLIHTSHPDRFFEMAIHKRLTRLPDPLEAELLQTPTALATAIAEVNQLCSEFEKEFVARGDRLQRYNSVFKLNEFDNGTREPPLTYEELPNLIQGGPKNKGPLKDFFDMTEKLKLARRHTEFPDPRSTLFRPSERGSEISENVDDDQRVHIRAALLGKGMCTKKKHEVMIMNDTIRSIVQETRRSTNNPSLTVMNVGEGKGYVSRVLSICEATPVVGIDCNPLHKEVALERLEPLLEVSNATQAQRKQVLNLNYSPRGRTTCVTCRVGSETDWEAVLRGCVPICNEQGELIAGVSGGRNVAREDTENQHMLTNSVQFKASCKACGKIIRCQNGAPLVKHARQHADRVALKKKRIAEQNNLSDETNNINDAEASFSRLEEWVVMLSPEQLVEKVRIELFTPFVDPSETLKRDRGKENESSQGTLCTFSRATDVILEEALPAAATPSTASNVAICKENVDRSNVPQRSEATVKRRITILGFDDSSNRYKVFIHEGEAKQEAQNGIVSGKSSMRSLREHGVTSVSPLKPLVPIVYPVTVPSLSSVVLMGLHTCGDLGASICRLYRETSAPSVVLVSCCWHALTSEGFPLSKLIKDDPKFATNSLSLMLATQPLDAFSNSSSEEHYGSSRLLFYRSMFSLLWEELRLLCEGFLTSRNSSTTVEPYDFSKHRPVLERSLLRSFARDKHTLTFGDFCRRVRDEAMDDDYLKSLAANLVGSKTEANSESEALLGHIQRFLYGDHSGECLFLARAQDCEERYFNQYYSSFVGFTTLRMWMSHLLEGLLLVDRLLYLCETVAGRDGVFERLSLLPLFDGALSPRLFAILGLKDVASS